VAKARQAVAEALDMLEPIETYWAFSGKEAFEALLVNLVHDLTERSVGLKILTGHPQCARLPAAGMVGSRLRR
jgi:hypothetical protein